MFAKMYRLLPRRVQASLYGRLLAKHRDRFRHRFEAAALKLAPGMHMRLKPTDHFHGHVAWMGIYEEELSLLLQSLSKNAGGLMIDVGANYGYFSLLWCAGRPSNQVFAIEASPANQGPLRHNIENNNLTGWVTVFDWAASNQDGIVEFNLGSSEETGWGGIALEGTSGTVRVAAHRLDSMFAGNDIELLKIDCEGADALVIEGAEALLSRRTIRHIVFEENLFRQQALGIEEGRVIKYLEKFGYFSRRLDKDPWIKSYHAQVE